MIWNDLRRTHPEQWLVIEALEAHTDGGGRRRLDRVALVDVCADGRAAFQRYRELHRKHPEREYYPVHTSLAEPEIFDEAGLPRRSEHAADPAA